MKERNLSLGEGCVIIASWGNGVTARRDCNVLEHSQSWCFISLLIRVPPKYSWVSRALHPNFILREWSSSSTVRVVKNPPAFPPFLHLMKTRGEDIRHSISRQSTSHVFRWIPTHVLSPASSGGSCCRALSAFLRGRGQWNQRWLSGADKRRLETDRRHLGVWWWDSARRPSGLSSAAAAQLASGSLRSGFHIWLAGGVPVGKRQSGSPQILLHCGN